MTAEQIVGTLLELEVGPVAHGGHCVARYEGQVVFVRHALPGELVHARVTEQTTKYLRADAVQVLTPSPQRIEPPCPYAGPGRCGGCDFQHADPAYQRELKAAVVTELLDRIGRVRWPDLVVEALPGGPLGWRSRVQYTVDMDGRAGLLQHRSHQVIPIDQCRIAHPSIQDAEVTGRKWPDDDTVEVVASGLGDVTVLAHTARGPRDVRERAVGREWTLDPRTFWQVHPAAADTLTATVVRMLAPRPGDRAWDLYGGVGLFAAALAPHLDGTGRLTVVESDPRAVADARRNLRDLTTVTVLAAPVEKALANPSWKSVDLVVLDPPRSGAGARVVSAIIRRTPRAVAYVACDPAALARDVRTFGEAGWRLSALRAFDTFPMTHHVECVALFNPPA